MKSIKNNKCLGSVHIRGGIETRLDRFRRCGWSKEEMDEWWRLPMENKRGLLLCTVDEEG